LMACITYCLPAFGKVWPNFGRSRVVNAQETSQRLNETFSLSA
jgi:hypothetical protein